MGAKEKDRCAENVNKCLETFNGTLVKLGNLFDAITKLVVAYAAPDDPAAKKAP